jgi:hypothetical protein
MAEPASGADAQLDRRHRRNERRRRKIRRVLGVVASCALFIGFVLVATDVVRFGGGDKPSLANTVEAGPGSAAAKATPSTIAARPCRALSVSDPLRMWVGGDSLAGSLGPSLGTIAGATGVVQPYFDSRVSSGLSTPDFFDWPDHATTVLSDISPDVVVFIIGANDWAAADTAAGKADYTQKVDDMLNVLIGSGRTVYWIGAPILRDEQMDAGVVQVDAIAAAEAKLHPEVQYVDAYKLFSDTDGMFALNLPDETGKVVTMRAGDGVHFTADGADYLARAVYKLIDTQCHVTAQQVAGQTKATIEAEGSTQVAPDSGSGSSGSGTGTVQTTPPATAPDTTPATTTPDPAPAPDPTTTTPAPTTGSTPSTPPDT